jgi:hypothetical protein
MSAQRGQESHSLLAAFVLERFRMKGINQSNAWPFDSPYRNHSYLSRGCYSAQLRQLYNVIPKQQVLVLEQQSLMNKHDDVMSNVFDFLNIQQMNIKPSQVFASEKQTKHDFNTRLATLYARLYFFIRRENRKRWASIIQL